MKKRYIVISSICAGSLLIAGTVLGIVFGVKARDKNKEDNKVLLSFGDIHASETKEIDVAKLAEITNAKENFLFVVSTTTCSCWNEFKPVLNTYLSSNELLCYRMDFNDFKNSATTFGLANTSSSTTTLAIFENGKVKTYLNSAHDENIMYNSNKFAKYMDEQTRLPGCYFINREDVETIKNSGKNAVIYFERSECGDCTALNPGILREYVKNNKNMKKIYVLDCQEYWRDKSKVSEEEYQTYIDAKDNLGLSTKYNPIYGYGSGVFPYFSYIENGQYSSGCVIYNDSITNQDGKCVIAESYYTNERVKSLQYTDKVIQGTELSSNDVDEIEYKGKTYYSWKKESKDACYKEILDSFLNYALTLSSFTF